MITSPVLSDVTIIRLSSPPLTITVLLSATHKLRTGAMCSLKIFLFQLELKNNFVKSFICNMNKALTLFLI